MSKNNIYKKSNIRSLEGDKPNKQIHMYKDLEEKGRETGSGSDIIQ